MHGKGFKKIISVTFTYRGADSDVTLVQMLLTKSHPQIFKHMDTKSLHAILTENIDSYVFSGVSMIVGNVRP